MKEVTRNYKLTWIENHSYYFRWFFSIGHANAWAERNLVDKLVCRRSDIHIVKVR